jgi:hypothetical protein
MKLKHLFLLALPIVMLACKKDKKDEDLSAFEQTAKDQALMETEMGNVFQIGNELGLLESYEDLSKQGPAYSGSLPQCANLVYTANSNSLLVDFGSAPCVCKDGITRQGRYSMTFVNGDYQDKDAVLTINFINYVVENVSYTGQIQITNKAGAGAVSVLYEVLNAKAKTPSGTISWQSNFTINKTGGGGTPSVLDDVYSIVGSSLGINRKGISFSAEISKPLKKKIKLGCATTYVSGIVDFEDSEKNFVVLDYDPFYDEACDKIATVKINNRVAIEFLVR